MLGALPVSAASGHATPVAAAPTVGSPASQTAAAALSAARSSLSSGAGPAASHDAGSVPYAAAPGTPWTPLYPGQLFPSARATPAMAYSATGQYVLYFGGGWASGSSTADTWIFAGGVWTNISATLTLSPSPREDASLVWDASDGYVLLFGGYTNYGLGYNGSYTLNDTWSFSGGAWTNITSSTTAAPSARFAPAMTYDYTDGYVVLFGGSVLNGAPLNDTWRYHAGTWTNISSIAGTAPSARDFVSFTDDPADGYALLYGGWNATTATLDSDTWSFGGGVWSQIATSGPGALRGAAMAYDTATLSVILFGGAASGFGGPFLPSSETWSYSGGLWTDLTGSISSPPPARYLAGFTNISTAGTLLLADGCLGQGCWSYLDLSDSWTYNAANGTAYPWVQIGVPGTQPSERATPAMVYDAADGYVLYFGGGWNGGTSTNDTWTFWNNTWTNITANVTNAPRFREDPAMAYDAVDEYVVLFGGYTATGGYGSPSFVLDDTWTYHAGIWRNITTWSSTHPSARFASVMAYDSADREAVLFGGSVFLGSPLNDTWVFHAGNWTDVTATAGASPGPRDFASMADDPTDGYMVLFGGWDSDFASIYNDTWAFSGNTWTQLHPAAAPEPLRGSQLAFEPVGGYLLLYGGLTYSSPGWPFGFAAVTWAFLGGNWTNLTPMITTEPPPRMLGGMAPVGNTGEIVMADGCIYQGCPVGSDLSDTWIYNWTNINGTFSTLAPVVVNSTATFLVHAVGGDGVYTYAYAGLPTGCASSNVAALDCTPGMGGNFTVTATVSDASGRSLSLALNISLPVGSRSLQMTATSSVLDAGQSVTFGLAAAGGAGAPWSYSYGGLPAGCASVNAPTLTCTPSSAGSYTVTATAVDVQGGAVSTSTPLLVHPHVTVAATLSAVAIDLGETVTVHATAAQGSASYTYAWSGLPTGCTSSAYAPMATCTPAVAGASTVSVSATDTLGQTALSGPLGLTVNPDPTVTAPQAVVSTTDPLTASLTATIVGGTGPFSVTWGFGDGTTGTGTTVSHTFASGGTYLVWVSISDARGYTASAQQNVTVVATSVPGPQPGPQPTHGHAATPWYESMTGMFGLGLAAGLVAVLLVLLWARQRRRSMDEGARLADGIEHAQDGGSATPKGPRGPA